MTACNSDYTIKPRGYFKIEFPQKAYQKFDNPAYPYSFEYPVYAEILKDSLFLMQKQKIHTGSMSVFPGLMEKFISAIKKSVKIILTRW